MRAAAIVKRAAVPTIGAAALAELTLSAAVSAKAGGGATRAVIRTAGRAGAIAPDPTHAGFSLARAQNHRPNQAWCPSQSPTSTGTRGRMW